MSTRLHIVVSEELLAEIDARRGDVPRSAWIRRALEFACLHHVRSAEVQHGSEVWRRAVELASREVTVGAVEQALGDRIATVQAEAPPAPAEQPECPDPGVVKEGRSSAGHREFPASAPLPASYRQSVPGPNVEGVRSSAEARRGVGPIPKGKP